MVGLEIHGGKAFFQGRWTLPHLLEIHALLEKLPPAVEVWEMSGVEALDTAGAWLLIGKMDEIEAGGGRVVLSGLKPSLAALLEVVKDTPACSPPALPRPGYLARLGMRIAQALHQGLTFLAFIGETAHAQALLLLRPWRLRVKSLLHDLQTAGFDALPIIGLLSFLVGIVIAYQGGVQLKLYGASIYIADLVGLAMLRELSVLMTAIIVAGRSGSAFTAQIGTMQVTEEIDALRTLGISPVELLVVPRVWAMVIALPLLTVFSDIMGVLGGMIMAFIQLDISFQAFLDRFHESMTLTTFWVGVGKAPVFAVIITLMGCYQGFQVKGGAESVGRHTTQSVVEAIFLVIVADALFSIAFSWLGI